jgi:hypothetical protein
MEWCCSGILVVDTTEVSSAADVKHGGFTTTVTTTDRVLAFSSILHFMDVLLSDWRVSSRRGSVNGGVYGLV